jgi:hypothetical protein
MCIVAVLAASGRAAGRTSSAQATTPMADIADLYAWVAGANLNLVMDVSPSEDGAHGFDPSVIYVFHLTSKPGLGVTVPGGTETQVVIRFSSNTTVECWVTGPGGTMDYVTGDPSNPMGISSAGGKLRVFAGRRSDPMFFDQVAFAQAVGAIEAAPSAVPRDSARCPMALEDSAGSMIRAALAGGSDAFAASNVMAIVVQVDRSLVNTGLNKVVAVWGSTHAGS